VLAIILVDFSNQTHIHELQELIEFLKNKNYSSEDCRVASISLSPADEHFEEALKPLD
jgi:hypothetical protein